MPAGRSDDRGREIVKRTLGRPALASKHLGTVGLRLRSRCPSGAQREMRQPRRVGALLAARLTSPGRTHSPKVQELGPPSLESRIPPRWCSQPPRSSTSRCPSAAARVQPDICQRLLLGAGSHVHQRFRRRDNCLPWFANRCRFSWCRLCCGQRRGTAQRKVTREGGGGGHVRVGSRGDCPSDGRQRREVDEDTLNQTRDETEERARGTCEHDEHDQGSEQEKSTRTAQQPQYWAHDR